jgi:tripartite-type tricarboxylate transporter receptor subunit TctC
VSLLGQGPSVLSVHASVPANSLKELLAHGRANPGKLTLSTSGGFAQYCAEMFHHMSGMKLVVVVYKGGFPALVDAMAGQVQINIGALIQTLPHMKAGKIRALATTGLKRTAPTPDLPSIHEAGIPGFEANNWWAVGAPAGTAPAIVSKLSGEAARYVKLPETLKRFEAEGVDADYRDPEGMRKMLPVEMAKWANVARVANIKSQ